MKRMLIAFLFFLVLSSSVIYASNPSEKEKIAISQNTIQSLINGIESDNTGLKTSSAYMIGELKITDAVILLMKIMREDGNEEARIAAALSLYKLGTPLSMNAIRQAIRFDNSERVKRLCLRFYTDYLNKN
jgi:HEAT repeats